MVQDALVASGIPDRLRDNPLSQMYCGLKARLCIKYCTYLTNYYLTMSVTSCTPWCNLNQLASNLKTVNISGSKQKNIINKAKNSEPYHDISSNKST